MPGTNMNSLVTGDGTEPEPTFGQKWGPVIGQGIGLGAGIWASRKAQQSAMQRSPEEAASLKGAMGAAGGLGQNATSLLNESRPYMAQPASYYQTLLHGNRGAMAQATAAPRAALNDQYRGAQADISRSGVRGAAREQLTGGLNRQRASQVAGLTTGVQPGAADALAKLGTTMAQTAAPMAGQAGTIYANLLNNGLANRRMAYEEGSETGKAAGKLAADLGTIAFGGKKKPGAQPQAPAGPDYTVPEAGANVYGPRQPGYEYGGTEDDYIAQPPPQPPVQVPGDYYSTPDPYGNYPD